MSSSHSQKHVCIPFPSSHLLEEMDSKGFGIGSAYCSGSETGGSFIDIYLPDGWRYECAQKNAFYIINPDDKIVYMIPPNSKYTNVHYPYGYLKIGRALSPNHGSWTQIPIPRFSVIEKMESEGFVFGNSVIGRSSYDCNVKFPDDWKMGILDDKRFIFMNPDNHVVFEITKD